MTLAGVALVWGCASSGPQVSPQITGALAEHGVDGPTYQKVAEAEKLGYNDILRLVQAGVPAHIIESYLQSTRTVYQFNQRQIAGLRTAGAPPQLLNYLEETRGFYLPSQPERLTAGRGPRYERTDSPLYQDEQPFAYNAPEVDYWYNSAYEESLYSPFSFDAD